MKECKTCEVKHNHLFDCNRCKEDEEYKKKVMNWIKKCIEVKEELKKSIKDGKEKKVKKNNIIKKLLEG